MTQQITSVWIHPTAMNLGSNTQLFGAPVSHAMAKGSRVRMYMPACLVAKGWRSTGTLSLSLWDGQVLPAGIVMELWVRGTLVRTVRSMGALGTAFSSSHLAGPVTIEYRLANNAMGGMYTLPWPILRQEFRSIGDAPPGSTVLNADVMISIDPYPLFAGEGAFELSDQPGSFVDGVLKDGEWQSLGIRHATGAQEGILLGKLRGDANRRKGKFGYFGSFKLSKLSAAADGVTLRSNPQRPRAATITSATLLLSAESGGVVDAELCDGPGFDTPTLAQGTSSAAMADEEIFVRMTPPPDVSSIHVQDGTVHFRFWVDQSMETNTAVRLAGIVINLRWDS